MISYGSIMLSFAQQVLMGLLWTKCWAMYWDDHLVLVEAQWDSQQRAFIAHFTFTLQRWKPRVTRTD